MNISAAEFENSFEDTIEQDSRIEKLCKTLARKDFVFISGEDTQSLLEGIDDASLQELSTFQNSWNELEMDTYMGDGAQYRKRRHATLSALPSSRIFKIEPHQPHYQSLSYNHLNGGLARHYAPIEKSIINGAIMTGSEHDACGIEKTTADESNKICLDEFTPEKPLDMAIVNDEHVFHGAIPIAQLDTNIPATRDVLVITFRRKI